QHQSYAGMQSTFPSTQRISDGGQQSAPQPTWNQNLAAPPPPPSGIVYHSEPGPSTNSSYVNQQPTYTITCYYVEYATSSTQVSSVFIYPDPDDSIPPTAMGLKGPPNASGNVISTNQNGNSTTGAFNIGQASNGLNLSQILGGGRSDQRYLPIRSEPPT